MTSPPLNEHLKASNGFSLVEALLIMTLLSVTILPFTLMMSQTAQSARGVYIQSSRSFLMNRLMDEMSPERPTYVSNFSQAGSMNTTTSESGEVIPYRRLVDIATAGASDTLNKTVYFYLYNKTTDSSSAPRFKTALVQKASQYRQRVGNTADLTDGASNIWFGDNNLYVSTASSKVPGYVSNMGTTASTVSAIVNVANASDAALFQNYREGTGNTNLEYNFDLINGTYTVKLYFCEINAAVTGSAPNRRLMDIYLEGTLQNSTPYSPYETTGGTYRANVQTFDVEVTDGTLNLSVRKNASSNKDALLSGILIQKRTMQ